MGKPRFGGSQEYLCTERYIFKMYTYIHTKIMIHTFYMYGAASGLFGTEMPRWVWEIFFEQRLTGALGRILEEAGSGCSPTLFP